MTDFFLVLHVFFRLENLIYIFLFKKMKREQKAHAS